MGESNKTGLVDDNNVSPSKQFDVVILGERETFFNY